VFFLWALAVLYPSRCVGCGRTGRVFCPGCRPAADAARRLRGGALPVLAAGRYAGVLRRAVLLYKRGRRDAGEALADLVSDSLGPLVPRDVVLVPVPTTARRRRARGFDQGALLARGVGARTGLPVLLVLAQVAGDAQRGRSRAARLAGRNRFGCTAPDLVAGARVLIVDDVMTTGATLHDAARVLTRSGAHVLGAVVIAYA
jgi:ComF family protein